MDTSLPGRVTSKCYLRLGWSPSPCFLGFPMAMKFLFRQSAVLGKIFVYASRTATAVLTRSISMVSKPFVFEVFVVISAQQDCLTIEFIFHFHFFGGHFPFFFRLSSIFFGGRLPSWVKVRLHTKNQLPRLPRSALNIPGWWWWWVPTHYQVKLQLMLRLSWAVTITFSGHLSGVKDFIGSICSNLEILDFPS